MTESTITDLVVSGSPYALLLVAVWWFNGKLASTEQRLYDRDEKHSKETEKYIETIKDLATRLAENTTVLNDNKLVIAANSRLAERIEMILSDHTTTHRTNHEHRRNVE